MARGVEEDRIAGRTIARVGLVIFAILASALVLLGFLARYYTRSHVGGTASYPIPQPPRINAASQAELKSYLAEQREHLAGYRWVDPQHSYVHVPIERAMELYAQQAATQPSQGGSP